MFTVAWNRCKAAEELNIHKEGQNGNGEHHDEIFNIAVITGGVNYKFKEIKVQWLASEQTCL